jgi:hypothetical protein
MTSTIPSPMPLIRADGEGYTYAGERVDGFADRPDLPVRVRVRLARLGERYAPKKLSATQRELLASPLAERDATRAPSDRQEGFRADALDAERAWEDGVYAELSTEQQEWVGDPSRHPSLSKDARYPLTLGQLHLLSGASERQLRHWTDEDLIPAHRAGTHRRYYSAAVARALLLAQMSPQQVAALIALRHGGDPGRRLWVLIGSVTASLADTVGMGEPERDSLRKGAQVLVDHRHALASVGFANIRSRTVRNGKGTSAMANESKPGSGMRGNRTRDEGGQLREKRGDTLIGTIEDQYGVDLGVRRDMRLDTYRERTGVTSIKDIVEQARER